MPERLFRSNLPDPPDRLIDVHVNVGITDADGLSYGRLPPDEYLPMMRSSGTTTACVFPPLMDQYREANQSVRTWAQDTDASLRPFARLGGARGPRPVRAFWQARRTVRSWFEPSSPDVDTLDGYAGAKLIPHMSGIPDVDLLREVSRRGLPTLIHAGTHSPASWIESQLLPRLDAPVILAHLGAYPCNANALKEAVDLAERVDRVYLDTSGVWLAGFMEHAVSRIPHKLVFGSDTPLMHPLVAWRHVASAVHDDTVLERIAFRTAEQILYLEKT